MYKRKIPLDFECGIAVATEVVGSKWKYCLLERIHEGIVRPRDMLAALPEITKRVLYQQLKELEFHRMIGKNVYPETPVRTEYYLTEAGRSVLPLVRAMNQWGKEYAPVLRKIENQRE